MKINEIENPIKMRVKPIKEKMDIYVPNIKNLNISRRNGMVCCFVGSGGSGKSSLCLGMFKDKNMYKEKFDNIYYFCPEVSFSSVKNHPFEKHDKVYHELSVESLKSVYDELVEIKRLATEEKEEIPNPYPDEEPEDIESDEEHEIQYSALIIDDFADQLKNEDLAKFINKFMIKARHLCVSFFITAQSYLFINKMIRKQITYITFFKPKNEEESKDFIKEMLGMKREDAMKLFDYVFDRPYNHLDVDKVNAPVSYYKNFNKLEIEK